MRGALFATKQSSFLVVSAKNWIASSQKALLAMTTWVQRRSCNNMTLYLKGLELPTHFYVLFCLLLLTGCVNYAGMHSTAKPYDANALNKPHHFSSHTAARHTTNWWSTFHDPELNQLIDTALNDSPSLAIAESRVTQAKQLAAAADAALWPHADFTTKISRERYSANILYPPPFGGHAYNQGYIGFNFNYEFDWWGKNREALAAKLSDVEMREANLAAAKLILTTAVIHAYLQLQYTQEVVTFDKKIVADLQALKEIVADRTKNNIASDIPLTQAIAEWQNGNIRLQNTLRNAELAEHELAVLIGKNPFTTYIQTRHYSPTQHSIHLPANLPANLLANRPDIQAARARMESTAHLVNVAKARFFPNINLHALLSLQSLAGFNYLFNTNSQDNALGAAIDLPLFDAGKRRGELGANFAEFDAAVNEYNETLLRSLRETADQMTQLQSLKQEKLAQRAKLSATEQRYQLTKARYHHGIIDYTAVLDVEQNLLQQRVDELQLESNSQQAFVGLVKALGGHYDG